jgi:hypothetical protein
MIRFLKYTKQKEKKIYEEELCRRTEMARYAGTDDARNRRTAPERDGNSISGYRSYS